MSRPASTAIRTGMGLSGYFTKHIAYMESYGFTS